jgi:predicted RNA methylase
MDIFKQLITQYEALKYALLNSQTFDSTHYGFPSHYYDIMESDQTRVDAFRRAFAAYDFRDKVVCEAGVGRLALSKYYLPYVKRAYLIESNPHLREYLSRYIHERGLSNKVVLLFQDAYTAELPEPVDALIAEMMSIWCINEHQVPVFQYLRRYLRPGGQLFPERIINTAQLARADFEQGHRHYPINFTRHWPEVLSLPVYVNTIDLYEISAATEELDLRLMPILSGEANALLLRSFIQISAGHNFTGTDSLMPPTVYQLPQARGIQSGQAVQLSARFRYGTSLDDAHFAIYV